MFLHLGLAIAGVAGISAPIIIHMLFRNRRKPIAWGAMRFLLEAYRKMRRRMQIEHFLLLAVRCLIVCVLGLALARPLLSGADIGFLQGGRTVYILIDNGAAASVEDEAGLSGLQRHKRQARGIVEALQQSDKVSVITIARPVEVLINTPVQDSNTAKKIISSVGQSDSPTDITEGLKKVNELLQGEENQGDIKRIVVYLLSDFLSGSVDVESQAGLSANLFSGLTDSAKVVLVASLPMDKSPGNVQITAIEPLRLIGLPRANDGAGQFRVRLRRTGVSVQEAGISAVRMQVDSVAAGSLPTVVQWEAGQAEATVIIGLDTDNILTGSHIITVSIDRDLLSLDNSRSIIFEERNNIKVGVVARREFGNTGAGAVEVFPGSAWIRRALNPANDSGSQIELIDIDPSSINRNILRAIDAVVVTRPDVVTDDGWGILREFVDNNGLLWLIPAGDSEVQLWTDKAIAALGLPWQIAREVEVVSRVNRPADNLVDNVEAGIEAKVWRLADNQPKSELFSMIEAELTNLVRSTEVFKRLPVVADAGSSGILLYEDGSAFMVMGRRTGGAGGMVIYLSCAPRLDWTTLPSKPFMVALAQEVIRQGIGISSSPQEITAGDQPNLDVPINTNFLLLSEEAVNQNVRNSVDNTTQIPMVTAGNNNGNRETGKGSNQMRPALPLVKAGVYNVISSANQNLGQMVVNADPASMVTNSQDRKVIENWLNGSSGNGGNGHRFSWQFITGDNNAGDGSGVGDGAGTGNGSDSGSNNSSGGLLAGLDNDKNLSLADLSTPLFILLLALLVSETLLARWFSHADRVQTERGLSETINPVAIVNNKKIYSANKEAGGSVRSGRLEPGT